MRINGRAVFAGAATVWIALTAGAADNPAPSDANDILPQEEIVRRVKAQHPGDIKEIELEQKKGRRVYEVDLIDEAGKKWELKLDAKTGEVLSSEAEESDEDEEGD
jgi:uncharacterized membrane protein YkoI